MARLTQRKSHTSERLAVLWDLRALILFMIEFYHRTQSDFVLLPDPDLLRPKTPLEAAGERTWGHQEPTP